ncbi:hypothetical protein EAH79_14250 [Sphingomonas koreensis]|nr:hypothetical protein EAH79_14250 [Sphingomonas koreensis]
MATIEVGCTFVGDFKVGDNLGYNCDLLCNLVEANARGAFDKMIVLQAGAILEAALTQIIYRAQNYNSEGVPNISEAERQQIEERKIDIFAVVIDVLRKYAVLDPIGGDIYDELHRLRRYRNKIHIQTNVRIDGVPRDEDAIFTADLTAWALDLVRRVLAYLSEALARPPHIHNYVGALRVPA